MIKPNNALGSYIAVFDILSDWLEMLCLEFVIFLEYFVFPDFVIVNSKQIVNCKQLSEVLKHLSKLNTLLRVAFHMFLCKNYFWKKKKEKKKG